MAGCFGNDPIDRMMERQLMRHLAETDFECYNQHGNCDDEECNCEPPQQDFGND